VVRGAEELLPVSGQGFDPMQSLALGGLGAAWGAAIFTYSRRELEMAGTSGLLPNKHGKTVNRTFGT
jgi:hypothetical protein